ncbi:hypothetical protein GF354_03800 [Candidatus Peregrinibacteria bacterium]|nr:hypothetical protein [Candidatus Peregrinibacteria bacterium]
MKKMFIAAAVFMSLFAVQLSANAQIYYSETIPSVVRLDVIDSEGYYGWGTGFFISSDAVILTAAHVVMDYNTGLPAEYIDICTVEDEYSVPNCIYSGEVFAYNEDIDLALVAPAFYIDEEGNEFGDYLWDAELGHSWVDLSDYNPGLAEIVTILGFPDASLLSSITLTEGRVSGFEKLDEDWIWRIATDATINPGNSGGPAYNYDERVVGVVTEVSTEGVGGNYGYIISNDIVYLWFLDLVDQEILNEDFVMDVFSNDYEDYSAEEELPDYNQYIEEELPEEIFSDVTSSTKNAAAISYLKDNGIISGYPDGTFKPNGNLNRAELLKILVEGKGYTPSEVTYQNCFPDVKKEWYAKYVCFAQHQGWIEGYPDGTFKPSSNVNKAEAIKMLLEVFDMDTSGEYEYVYNDVQGGEWFTPYIGTAYVWGLLEEDGLFYRPGADITRGQISENIYRLLTIEVSG